MYRQCSLTQCIVDGLPSPDKLPAVLIMFISEKSYSYRIASYIHKAIVVSVGTYLHKLIPAKAVLPMALIG